MKTTTCLHLLLTSLLACTAHAGSLEVATAPDAPKPGCSVLREEAFRHYVEDFNKYDTELYKCHIPNVEAWEFLKDNISLLECPDEDIQRTYYFRWWTFRKHINTTARARVCMCSPMERKSPSQPRLSA